LVEVTKAATELRAEVERLVSENRVTAHVLRHFYTEWSLALQREFDKKAS
jgi:hypothetical protein